MTGIIELLAAALTLPAVGVALSVLPLVAGEPRRRGRAGDLAPAWLGPS